MEKTTSIIIAAAVAATLIAPATIRAQNAAGGSSVPLALDEVEKLLEGLPNLQGKSEEELEKILAEHPEYLRRLNAAGKKAKETLSAIGGDVDLDALEAAFQDLKSIEELQGKSEDERAKTIGSNSGVRNRVSAAGRGIAAASGAAGGGDAEGQAQGNTASSYNATTSANTDETAVIPDNIMDAVTLPDGASTNAIDEVFFGELQWDFGGFRGQNAEKTNVHITGLKMGRDGMSFKYVRDLSEWGIAREDASQALACLFVCDNNGRWIGGKFDWISSSRNTRDFKNIYGGYEGWSLNNFPNPCGVAFVIVSADGRKRSNVIGGMWER